jgi:hypothetical protein
VRSCQPGHSEETDPGADGYWSETPSIFGLFATGTRRGWGYMTEISLAVTGPETEHFEDAGAVGLGWTGGVAPLPGVQGYSRVRMRYGNGAVVSCNPLPVESPSGSGGCS